VVSDDHEGLKKAIVQMLRQVMWQCCYVHLLRNALDHVPRKLDDDCVTELRMVRDRRNPDEARRDLGAWLFVTRGVPEHMRSDNGPESIAQAMRQWLANMGCQTIFITPGSPWENAYIESFIGKLRDQCLNREIFANLREAQGVVEAWREEYNNE